MPDQPPPLRSAVPFCYWAASQNVNSCIVWPMALTPSGYGRVRFKGRRTSAHRIVLEIANGPPPTPKHHAAHTPVICHNRACVNPRHLRWATPHENSADRHIDGSINKDGRPVGVSFSGTRRKPYRAYAYISGPNSRTNFVYLGSFSTEEEAIQARAAWDRRNNQTSVQPA
jgi:hypothetical protein